MRTVDSWGWIDAPVGEVVDVATDARRLPDWFTLVRGTHAGGRLGDPGDVAVVEWRGRPTPTTLRVDRRTRDVVHLEAEDGSRLCLSLSPWNGGTAVELSVDVPRRTDGALTTWHLSRSIRRLSGLLEAAAVTAGSDSGRTRDLVPRADAPRVAHP